MNFEFDLDPDGAVTPGKNHIDIRRNHPLGTPFFLSKKYDDLDKKKVHLTYIGHIIYGNKPPFIASLRVHNEFGIGRYIKGSKGNGKIHYWMDCSRDVFVLNFERAMLKLSCPSPVRFLLTEQSDFPICSAYLTCADFNRRVREEKLALGHSPAEERAVAKYRESIDVPIKERNPRRKK